MWKIWAKPVYLIADTPDLTNSVISRKDISRKAFQICIRQYGGPLEKNSEKNSLCNTKCVLAKTDRISR